MKSIKPGRGPSAMGAAGSIFAIIFGIFWTIATFAITRDVPFPAVGIIFPLFGVGFVFMGIMQFVFHYKNATGKERMSLIDITEHGEEPDPLNARFGHPSHETRSESGSTRASDSERLYQGDYCPYCGTQVKADFAFCPKCGKDI